MSTPPVVRPSLVVRPSEEADLPAIQAIYQHHVLTGTGTFEEDPPTLAEMTARRAKVLGGGYPYLVAVDPTDGTVAGYAYVGPYRERSAYRFMVEDSIYIAPGRQGQGVGRLLLTALLAECEARGYRQIVAVIGDSANAGSVGLHAALGFQHVGKFTAAGLKFGRWLDVVFMQKALGAGAETVPGA